MYKNDADIMRRVSEHLLSALEEYSDLDWFVICAQGSMNYELMYEDSDIDTKLLTLPSIEDLVLNKKPMNTVHIVKPTEEHCDIKDVREYFKIFRKQNINFVEILFTPYYIVNPKYADFWYELMSIREDLVRMNEYAAVSCIVGMAMEKRHALSHKYPSKRDTIEKYGFDPKQLHHLARLRYFLAAYVRKEEYSKCLVLPSHIREYLIDLKKDNAGRTKEEAEKFADEILEYIKDMGDRVRGKGEYSDCAPKYINEIDPDLDYALNSILYNLVVRSLKDKL